MRRQMLIRLKWQNHQRARYGFCGYGPTIRLTPVDGYGVPGLLFLSPQ